MDLAARKIELVEAAKAHFAADMLVKGTYGADAKDFKGCSVGCLAHNAFPEKRIDTLVNSAEGIHKHVADHYGYPVWLAYLQDTIFEGLPNGADGENNKWHVQLAEAIAALPADHDWQATLHRVHAAILRISYRTAGAAQEPVQAVLDLHERAARGEVIESAAWSAAESAAWSAAWSAARSAAESAEYQEIRDAVLAALPEPVAA